MRLLIVAGILLISAGLVGFTFLDVDLERSHLILESSPIWQGRTVESSDLLCALVVLVGTVMVMLDGVRQHKPMY